MILIFCFQSNKHWHENEPQAERPNEKMKLVFQLTDQKHFIHYNQAFIWHSCSVCMHVRVSAPVGGLYVFVCVCGGGGGVFILVSTLFMLYSVLCHCPVLLHVDELLDISQRFVPHLFCWLQFYISYFTVVFTEDGVHHWSNLFHMALLSQEVNAGLEIDSTHSWRTAGEWTSMWWWTNWVMEDIIIIFHN